MTHETEVRGEIICSVFTGAGEDIGYVGMVLQGSPLVMYKDLPCPGAALTPTMAREVAAKLIECAEDIENNHAG
jgi:hypothetical protein